MKLVYIAVFLMSDSHYCWIPTLWFLGSDQHIHCFVVLYKCHVVRHIHCFVVLHKCHEVQHTSMQECWRTVTVGSSNTIYHLHAYVSRWIYPGTSYTASYTPVALRWRFRSSAYTLMTLYRNGVNCPPCLIPCEHRNVIDNELYKLGYFQFSIYRHIL